MAEKRTFPVSGMTCGNCVAHVEKALKGVAGVSDVQVDLEGGKASAQLEDGVEFSALVEAVREAGYNVPTETVEFGVGGMTCNHCAMRVKNALQDVDGVVDARIDLEGGKVAVTALAGAAQEAALRAAVTEAGYQPQ